jgi:hypothetical protein
MSSSPTSTSSTPAAARPEQAAREVPEYERAYPDPDVFGTMPAWGLFVRHVANLRVRGVELPLVFRPTPPAVAPTTWPAPHFADFALRQERAVRAGRCARCSDLRTRDAAGWTDGAHADTVSATRR